MSYVNLPGTYASIVDGNLRSFTANQDPRVLILGTATSGQTEQLYIVNKTEAALAEFGQKSELGRALVEAQAGGARNIVLYRLPGVAPAVYGLGAPFEWGTGPTKLKGIKIEPYYASPEAANRYGLVYRHAVPLVDEHGEITDIKKLGEVLIADLLTRELVYHSDIENGVMIDTGVVKVEVDPAQIDFGNYTPFDKESFALQFLDGIGGTQVPQDPTDLLIKFGPIDTTEPGTLPLQNVAEDGPLAMGDFLDDLVGKLEALDLLTGSNFTFIKDDGLGQVRVIYNKAPLPDANGFGLDSDGNPFTLLVERAELSDPASTVLEYGTASSVLAVNIGSYPEDLDNPMAAVGGGTFVPLSQVVSTATSNLGAMYEMEDFDVSDDFFFVPGDAQAEISLMQRYEKLDRAYELLDFREFDIVLPQGAFINAKNATEGAAFPDIDEYPAPRSGNDVLCKLAMFEDPAVDNKVYAWDTDDSNTAKILSEDVPTPATLTFVDVNFAHQLALYCHDSTTNYKFCMGVVPVEPPSSVNPAAIKNFFGKAPKFTFDNGLQEEFILSPADNGSGLLGHRLIGGHSSYRDGKAYGGIFLTEDRTLTGTAVIDANEMPVDLGKYLLTSALFGLIRNQSSPRAGQAYMSPNSNLVGGILAATPVEDSLTNVSVPGVRLNYLLPAKIADIAAGFRLMVFMDRGGVPVIADSPTMAHPSSDFRRVTTWRIVSKVAQEVRIASETFLGKGQTTSRSLAHEQAIQGVLEKNISEDRILQGGSFQVSQTRAQLIQGAKDVSLSLLPVFELRRVNLTISLNPGE